MSLIGKMPSPAETNELEALVIKYGLGYVLCMIQGICEDEADKREASKAPSSKLNAEQWRLAAGVCDQASTRCVELVGFADD